MRCAEVTNRAPVLTIAVLTYLRPEPLASLLGLVAGHLQQVEGFTTEILVVDNDPQGSAEATVRGSSVADVRYVNERTPGIAAARRRALRETRDSAAVVFLDDDLMPSDDWLTPLISIWQSTRAAAVVGHVHYEFAEGTDPWVIAGGFFRRTVHSVGADLAVAATGNLLLDRAQVAASGVDFDPTLGMSGGEDTLFSRQLSDRGGRIVYCPSSVVVGDLPSDRTDREAALTRARAHGGIGVRVDLACATSRRSRFVIRMHAVVGGLARLVVGASRATFGRAAHDVAHAARGARLAARGRGMLGAGLGRFVDEYTRDD